jgi:hypothetical protein
MPVITIELQNSLQMPPPDEVKRIWQDMIGWIARNVPSKQQAEVHQGRVIQVKR